MCAPACFGCMVCVCVFRLNNRETNPIERDDVAHSFQTDFSLEIHTQTRMQVVRDSESETEWKS